MEQALSVSQLNHYVKLKLDEDDILRQVVVCGELSGVSTPRSGHIYFKLKDERAVVSCAMFRMNAERLAFRPQDGQRVIVYGSVTLYETDGRYQIIVTAMQTDGQGDLTAEYERLKHKLNSLGIFDDAHKRPLPKFPKRIGVITSATGAAIRDIIRVCGRRWPAAELVLYPTLVQGEDAESQLVEAVEWFDAHRTVDVLIIGRGGGSMEDLWCFNSEALAYAVYNCEIPVVSAVGHEIDFTICDFAADVRAATPSMAAELVCPDSGAYSDRLVALQKRLASALNARAEHAAKRLEHAMKRPLFTDPTYLLGERWQTLGQTEEMLERRMKEILQIGRTSYEKAVIQLNALSPLATLSRGYAAVFDEQGGAKTDFEPADVGKTIAVRLKSRKADCVIERISEEL